MRIGLLGVGAMGGAMAGRALKDGLEVVVYDVDAEATARYAAQGAVVATSPRDLAEQSDLVAVVVMNDEQVRSVLSGADGILAAGCDTLDIAIHSTIQLPTLYEVALQARERGFTLFDAGVSGGVSGADAGELAIMCGGDEATVDRCRPCLETYGGLVRHVGALGAGMKAKVARNLIGFVVCTAAYEGMRLAEEAGVDLGAFAEIFRHSETQGQLFNFFLSRPTVRPQDPSGEAGRSWRAVAESTVGFAHKDLSAALALARELGIRLPASEEARRIAPVVWGLEEGERAL